jgi:bifunctional DNA-binding transcriptional regulator/antitoxin component of YhaV-PrlF toxin-antitoxin module
MPRKHAATIRIIGDGRVTIPSDIRELESIEKGDYVKITIEKIETDRRRKQPAKAKAGR